MDPSFMNADDALLIVDVQRDFCPGGALPVPAGDEVVPVLNRWIEAAQQCGATVVASRDWHPPQHISFQERGGPWPAHCVQQSEGARFHPELRLPPQTQIVDKGMHPDRDNYSAFDSTPLGDELRHHGIHRVFVGGLALDVCVRASAIDARKAGLEVHLIRDGAKPIDDEGGAEALEEMRAAGVFIDDTDAG